MKDTLFIKSILGSLLLLSACAEQVAPINNRPTTRNDDGTTSSSAVRYCDSVLKSTSTSKLSDFFSINVSGLEGAPTFCISVDGYGTNVDAAFMVEYEDNKGIRSVTFDTVLEAKLVFNETTDKNELTIIFRDTYGLVQVTASADEDESFMTGRVRYYNFPSYEEALDAAIKQKQTQCQNGTLTVYECMGYTYPTHWWNQSTSTSQGQRVLEAARAIFADASQYKTLGTIEFDVSESTMP